MKYGILFSEQRIAYKTGDLLFKWCFFCDDPIIQEINLQ